VSRLALTRDDGRNEIKNSCQDEQTSPKPPSMLPPPALGKSEN
jgi:hypothetical protein